MLAGCRAGAWRVSTCLPALQTCRFARNSARQVKTIVRGQDPLKALQRVSGLHAVDKSGAVESSLPALLQAPIGPEQTQEPIRLTKDDVIDKDLYESLCNQCDLEESAVPLALACRKFKEPRQVVTILECTLNFCHIERLTFEEQSVVLWHVATHVGNQSVLFGDDLRAACGYVQGLVREYNQSQLMRVVWSLTELLGTDSHVEHLLPAVFNRFRRDTQYLGGEQLMLLAKALWYCRSKTNLVTVMHPTIWRGFLRKLDACSPNEIVEGLHALHDVKPLPTVDRDESNNFCRALRRDLRIITTENIPKAALLFNKIGLVPQKGEALIVRLVDEFISRAPLLENADFLMHFCIVLSGCDFLQRQVVACMPLLNRCIGNATAKEIVLLAAALSNRRVRDAPGLSLARDYLTAKMLENVEQYDARTCSLLLHNVLQMRAEDELLLNLLAAQAFTAHATFSLDEKCLMVHDYSLFAKPRSGIDEAFCVFVYKTEIGRQLLSWNGGVRLASGMLRLRFNHRDWLQAIHAVIAHYPEQVFAPDNVTHLGTIIECLYMLNSVPEKLIRRLLLPAERASLEKLSLANQTHVFLSAHALGLHCDGWFPSIDDFNYAQLAGLKPSVRYLLCTGCLAGGSNWPVMPDVLKWLRLDLVPASRYTFFEHWLGGEFVVRHLEIEGCFPRSTLLLADHSRHLVPWSHLNGWEQLSQSDSVSSKELMDLCRQQSLQPIAVIPVWYEDYLLAHRELCGVDKTRTRIAKSHGYDTLVLAVNELFAHDTEWCSHLQRVLTDNQFYVPAMKQLEVPSSQS